MAIQERSRPESPLVRQIFHEQHEYLAEKTISDKGFRKAQRERSRKLYPPLKSFHPINDFLQEADDTDATVAAIKRSQN